MGQDVITVEREVVVPGALIQLVGYAWDEPPQGIVGSTEQCYLDLSLTPRVKRARGSYIGQWNSGRYERLGELYCVPPKFNLHACALEGQQRSLTCQIGAERLSELADGTVAWNDKELAASLNIENTVLRQYLVNLAEELERPGFASNLLVEGLSIGITVELMRHFLQLSERTSLRKGGLAPWRLRLIEDRVRSWDAPPSLSELAKLCGLTTRHLMRAFRHETGQTVHSYVEAARVKQAKTLLMEYDRSIKLVSLALGFANPASFSYAFRKITGKTPREFREESRRMQMQPMNVSASRKNVCRPTV